MTPVITPKRKLLAVYNQPYAIHLEFVRINCHIFLKRVNGTRDTI